MQTRRKIWISVIAVLAITGGLYVAASRYIAHYERADRSIRTFCMQDQAGHPVENVFRLASASGLLPSASVEVAVSRRIVGFSKESSLLPILSVCTLRLSGTTVVSASFDPWYH